MVPGAYGTNPAPSAVATSVTRIPGRLDMARMMRHEPCQRNHAYLRYAHLRMASRSQPALERRRCYDGERAERANHAPAGLAEGASMTIDRRDPLLRYKIAAHRAMRFARWAFERWSYARERGASTALWHLVAEHRSRLVRDPARALLEMTAGKAHNLTLAAAALDGILIHPGETLSFWFLVGEPSAARGYRHGME